MRIYTASIFTLLLFVTSLQAQAPERWTSGDIYHGIEKLNFLGSALYIAAHPDDENTGMISYLSNHVKANTAYLSLTRGDGGQNLIGTELKELLGVIRTQELLAARKIDGGKQFFTRANDFGYSKHPDETLAMWNKDEVLADVVWNIRRFQPDIIINRFKHDTPGTTHGHHTSSAVLSVEAWDLLNDPTAFPSQLEFVDVWQPQRLAFNTSWWFYGSREKFAKADKSNLITVDAGVYYPNRGMSNGEIAAISRAQHRCQGMGRSLSRSSRNEYLDIIKGDVPSDGQNLFEGVNTSWSRLKGGVPITGMIDDILANFNYSAPHESISALVKTYQKIEALEISNWRTVKLEEIKKIIAQCGGLYTEAAANNYFLTAGQNVEIALEFTNRSPNSVKLKNVSFIGMKKDTSLNLNLVNGEENKFYLKGTVPSKAKNSSPYWLEDKGALGMYSVKNQIDIGKPTSDEPIIMVYDMEIEGVNIKFHKPVAHRSVSPVMGEQFRPVEIIPAVSVSVEEKVVVFADNNAKKVNVKVMAGKDNIKGQVMLDLPSGWSSKPDSHNFDIANQEQTQSFVFEVVPPANQSEGTMNVKAVLDGKSYSKELILIDYDHIPKQTIFLPAETKIVKLDIQKKGQNVAYIMGAGDKIPESLRQIGYEVDLLEDNEITKEKLANYDALIIGIRAYNTRDKIKFQQEILLDYVKEGGTMIVQYNTGHRLKVPSDQLGPYPFKVSRDRVAVEEAEIRFLKPDHKILNSPNKISTADFDNWVQERGLYFPNEWSKEYTAVLSSNDPGESNKDGGLLVAEYGKGHYVYTGYSWFRELPAGVPGAYRIFANMISLGK